MAIWRITNYHKKNAVERQIWIKDDVTVVKEEGFRWGIWETESDEQPDIDLENPDGWEPDSDEWEFVEMIDGCWVEWIFPDDMDEEEQERIQELWNEDSFEGLEGDGWVNDETEFWLYGPLELTNVDTGEEFHGEEEDV